MDNINKYWNKIANDEPYWGVLTNNMFKNVNIEQNKNKYFLTGLDNKKFMFNYLDKLSWSLVKYNNILEIGCGTGRISVHTTPLCKKQYCVDISDKYIELCKYELELYGSNNFEMVNYSNFYKPDIFENVALIYTFITLQHNPPNEILKIVKKICELLMKDGIAFVHIPYYIPNYKYVDALVMQMNMVPTYEVINIIDNNSCKILSIDESHDYCGGNIKNCVYIFKKI